MKTLFVTDLDGTLLNDNTAIDPDALFTLNSLIAQGSLFSVATGRSYTTAKDILNPIDLNLPVLLLNGVQVFDMKTKKTLFSNAIRTSIGKRVLDLLRKEEALIIFYVIREDGHVLLFYENASFDTAKYFIDDRRRFFQKTVSFDAVMEKPLDKVLTHHPISFIIVLPKRQEDLSLLFSRLKSIPSISYHLYQDKGAGTFSIEIFSDRGGKDSGISFLKNYCHADKTISFGDNLNDVVMKTQSDLFCAVENALPTVKTQADKIIPTNNESGVISFITNYEQYKQSY